jgi:hypothetical protein
MLSDPTNTTGTADLDLQRPHMSFKSPLSYAPVFSVRIFVMLRGQRMFGLGRARAVEKNIKR